MSELRDVTAFQRPFIPGTSVRDTFYWQRVIGDIRLKLRNGLFVCFLLLFPAHRAVGFSKYQGILILTSLICFPRAGRILDCYKRIIFSFAKKQAAAKHQRSPQALYRLLLEQNECMSYVITVCFFMFCTYCVYFF
jgi:hypothetical protein